MPVFAGLRELLSFKRTLRRSKARIFFFLAAAVFLSLGAAFSKEPDGDWTERTLRSLSLRDKIAQLVQVRVPAKFMNRQSPEFQAIRNQIRENHVGGVVLFAGNVYESAILLNDLQLLSRLPLLVAADFERGVSFRISDTTSFPWTMAIGATGSEKYAYDQGLITGQEARALGVHWIFAPVMDVNSNPDNPVINIRSFGEDPELVARLGAAFIRGAKKGGVLTTAKHFPGHGDTATDSHIGLAVVASDLSRLQAVEFVPFKSAIDAGVDSIMTAHVAVPQVTGLPEVPATLSSEILTDILQGTLKFSGLVVTDALEMGGITNNYWCGLAAVRALKAGADVLLLPLDPTVAINEVERAVMRGEISETRIDQSVRKVLNAKSRMGLQRSRTVSISRIGDIIASPSDVRLAQDIADHSVTAVKDDRHLLPVNPVNDTRVFSIVLASDLESSPGTIFQSEMRRHFSSLRTAWANVRISEELLTSIDKAVSESDLIVCSTLARLNSGSKDTTAIPQDQRMIIGRLIASGKPMIWVSFGNPYVLRVAPEIGTYLCTFSYSDVSQIAAAKALAGEIEITGRMPVSIPGCSKAGDGLQIPKAPMTLQPATAELTDLQRNQFEETRELLNSIVNAGIFPGAELLIGYQGKTALDFFTGKTGYSSNSVKVTPETLYPAESLSRIIATSAAAMLAVDAGSLLPEALVRDYLPELGNKDSAELRIRELLTEKPEIDSRADLVERIVTRATGVPIERFLAKNLFEPLRVKHLSDYPAKRTDKKTAKSTDTGAFCSARDLAVFAQMLVNRGMYAHHRYFEPGTVAKYTGPHGMWSKPSTTDWTGSFFSASSFGHISKSGPVLWIDPAKQLFIVFLTSNGTSMNGAEIADAQKRLLESVLSQLKKGE
jgi:beta-glucosidase-like glycosyl hydrolase/CubicO group peptidase (beta-lactamase class C family)